MGRVADLGAGRGALSMRLRDQAFDVVSSDLDPTAARENGIDCEVLDLDGDFSAAVSRGSLIVILDTPPFARLVATAVGRCQNDCGAQLYNSKSTSV